jgi:hypothetical protein
MEEFMLDDEELNNQYALLKSHRQTLSILLRQQAKQGGDTFAQVGVINSIIEAREYIRKIKDYLRSHQVSVDDHPDDDPHTSEAGPARFDLRITVSAGFVPFQHPSTGELKKVITVLVIVVQNVGLATSFLGKIVFRLMIDGKLDDYQVATLPHDREIVLANPKPDAPIQPGSEQRYVFRLSEIKRLLDLGKTVIPLEVIVYDQIGHTYHGSIHENLVEIIRNHDPTRDE